MLLQPSTRTSYAAEISGMRSTWGVIMRTCFCTVANWVLERGDFRSKDTSFITGFMTFLNPENKLCLCM